MIRNVLFRICGSRYLDDLTQETFIKVWRGISGFQHDSSLKTWIYSIATRVAIDHFRKRGDTFLTELDEGSLPSQTNEESGHVRRDLVRKGLRTLSFDHRTTLVLHVLEGRSLEEVARITSTALGTVKSRLHYARNAMAGYLESEGVHI